MNFHFLPRSNGLFWKKCRGWFFFRKIGFLPFFYKHLWKGPSWRLLFWFKLLFMDSATWNLFKKPWLIKIWEDLAEKQQKMWQRLEILKKFQNLSKKKTAKIGPKSKKQKHRKLPTDEYYRRMKSFFQNTEPILSVFFLTCHFWDIVSFFISRCFRFFIQKKMKNRFS